MRFIPNKYSHAINVKWLYYPPEMRRGGFGNIPIAILLSCQNVKIVA